MTHLTLADSRDAPRLESLLTALGAVYETRSLPQLLDQVGRTPAPARALILADEHLMLLGEDVARGRALLARYQHVLVYPFGGASAEARALGVLLDCTVHVRPAGDRASYTASSSSKAAGPFAGLEVRETRATRDSLLTFTGAPSPAEPIVQASAGGALFTRITHADTEIFVLASGAVFEPGIEATTNLRTQECFSSLVPLLLFLRHARVSHWKTNNPSACVIIDDLNLRRRYGFVDTGRLARFVDDAGCAVSVAFIPWNWNRTSPSVAALFAARWPKLSLCVHGCDHIGAEFSTVSVAATLPMIASSLERMTALASRAGITYDKIMVFPQGRFSAPAMDALRQSTFIAAINTEVADESTGRGVVSEELLAPAVTTYGGFPLFLRRKLTEPIADYALDMLLGKPCIVVTHHDDFQDDMRGLASLVKALRTRQPDLCWANPEAIATQTYATRRGADSMIEIRAVSPRTILKHHHGNVRFVKREPLADSNFDVFIGGRAVVAERDGRDLSFRAIATESAVVEVLPSQPARVAPAAHPLTYRSKVAARRYLSEFRDNYVAKSPWAKAAVRLVRRPHVAGNRA